MQCEMHRLTSEDRMSKEVLESLCIEARVVNGNRVLQ